MVKPGIQEIIDDVVDKMGKKSTNEKRTDEGNRKEHARPDRSRDREGAAIGKKG
jgi:hypothetical protein